MTDPLREAVERVKASFTATNCERNQHAIVQARDLRLILAALEVYQNNPPVLLQPDGYVLAPTEPTEEMAVAGNKSLNSDPLHNPKLGADWSEDCYRAMLAARPLPPGPREG